MKLTNNFNYNEFFISSRFPRIAESMKKHAPEQLKTLLYLLCHSLLQPIRDYYGVPIEITSGYRNHNLNSRIKGASKTSLHTQGIAADFTVKHKPNLLPIFNHIRQNLPYGQVILYEREDGTFRNIHVALPALDKPQFHQRRIVLADGSTVERDN